MNDEAMLCTQRAERVKDKEAIALHKLAKLYLLRGEEDNAAKCFRLNLQRYDKEEVHSVATVEALRFLAEYHKKKGER